MQRFWMSILSIISVQVVRVANPLQSESYHVFLDRQSDRMTNKLQTFTDKIVHLQNRFQFTDKFYIVILSNIPILIHLLMI